MFSHLHARPVQAGINRAFTDSKNCARLCRAEVLHISQDEDLPVPIFKTLQSCRHYFAQLLALQFLGRYVSPAYKLSGLKWFILDLLLQ